MSDSESDDAAQLALLKRFCEEPSDALPVEAREHLAEEDAACAAILQHCPASDSDGEEPLDDTLDGTDPCERGAASSADAGANSQPAHVLCVASP